MTNQQWETCELVLENTKYHKASLFGGSEGWSYDCYVYFHAATGKYKFQYLAELDKILDFHPFRRAMSILGSRGWELVSVQYATYTAQPAGNSPGLYGFLTWGTKVAYFKRPVDSGRPGIEPDLVF